MGPYKSMKVEVFPATVRNWRSLAPHLWGTDEAPVLNPWQKERIIYSSSHKRIMGFNIDYASIKASKELNHLLRE